MDENRGRRQIPLMLREHIVKMHLDDDNPRSYAEIARVLMLRPRTVRMICLKWHQHGNVRNLPKAPKKKKLTAA